MWVNDFLGFLVGYGINEFGENIRRVGVFIYYYLFWPGLDNGYRVWIMKGIGPSKNGILDLSFNKSGGLDWVEKVWADFVFLGLGKV